VGVAADPTTSDVYVVDLSHHRLDKFEPHVELDGEVVMRFVLMFGGHVNEESSPANPNICVAGEKCKTGVTGTGDGEFSQWKQITSFISVGPGGDVYVGDKARVQVFEPSGAWKENVSLGGLSATGEASAVAVDKSGDVFVKDSGVAGVRELEPAGGSYKESAIAFDTGSTTVRSLAIDSANDHLFVGDSKGGFHVLEYDNVSGEELESFGAGTVGSDTNAGLAFSSAADAVYASDFKSKVNSSMWSIPLPPPGPTVDSESVTAELHGTATLEAQIDPQGHETTYHFEYVSQKQYEASGFAAATITATQTLAAGFSDEAVSTSLGLTAGESYRWRVVASNEKGTATAEAQSFEETPPAVIEGPWATEVSGEAGTLTANVVNPQSLSTTYRLEYGTSTASESVAAEGAIGASEGSAFISRHIQGLQAATTYHYRVVTTNTLGTFETVDRTFTTQFAGGGPALPDGRVWELVSPANKHGALIENAEGSYDIQAAADGSGIAYVASESMLEGQTEGRQFPFETVISRRGSDGWGSEEVHVPLELPPSKPASELTGESLTNPPVLFSTDLSEALLSPGDFTPALSSEATERTLYLRNNDVCPSNPRGCYTPLVTPADVPAGTEFGKITTQPRMGILAASRDLSHVVFRYPTALTPEASDNPMCTGEGVAKLCHPYYNLYEWSAGRLQLINVLPGAGRVATPVETQVSLGRNSVTTGSALSSDGRRAVWSYERSGNEIIFEVRDMVQERTVQLGGASAVFQAMSSDGSHIFYLEGGDLHVLDFDSGTRTDITANHGTGEASAGVPDQVEGTSEDGTYVYFVAHGVLAAGAVAGGENLYLAREEGGAWKVVRLIATLSNEDEKDWSAFQSLPSPGLQVLAHISSRVSPSGEYLAFMSNRSLTGYDNVDAGSPPSEPRRDEEVYLYDAQSGRLACASCDPTGARPVGVLDEPPSLLVDRTGTWEEHWLGGSTPSWNDVEGGLSVYQPRFLSDSGRLFFDSPDALVPQDTNGLEDVYEYEPAGVGGSSGCTIASAAFSERSGGCVSLISSGTSKAESVFYDASENGDDAFFVTAGRLTAADHDSVFDVYDAHVCSSGVGCAAGSVSTPSCTTSDSCRVAPSLQPQVLGSPPSATFSGAGNVTPPAPGTSVKAKSLTRAQKLARALRACVKKRGRRRVVCEREARKRFGAVKSSKANARKGSGR
jgi:hypothetical protein